MAAATTETTQVADSLDELIADRSHERTATAAIMLRHQHSAEQRTAMTRPPDTVACMAINWDADPVAACWFPLADCSEDMRMRLEENPNRVLRHRFPRGETPDAMAFIREKMVNFKYFRPEISPSLNPPDKKPPNIEILSTEDLRTSNDPRNAKFRDVVLKWDEREKAENIAMFGFNPEDER
jgi:hypothetical protein